MKAGLFAACALAVLGFSAPASAQQAAPDAKALFEQYCKSCHGVHGIPPQAMVKMLKVPRLDAAYFQKRMEDTVAAVVKKGRGKMPAFADKLTPEQMAAVARYVREMATPTKEK